MAAKQSPEEIQAKGQQKVKPQITRTWAPRFLGELIPYLGGWKYYQLCIMSKNYEIKCSHGTHIEVIADDSIEDLEPMPVDEESP